MNTSACHLSLFLPVGCRRMETEEKKRERCKKWPDRDKKSLESGGRREKGLSFSLLPTCCDHMKKDEDGETRRPPNRRPSSKGDQGGEGEEEEEGNTMAAEWCTSAPDAALGEHFESMIEFRERVKRDRRRRRAKGSAATVGRSRWDSPAASWIWNFARCNYLGIRGDGESQNSRSSKVTESHGWLMVLLPMSSFAQIIPIRSSLSVSITLKSLEIWAL